MSATSPDLSTPSTADAADETPAAYAPDVLDETVNGPALSPTAVAHVVQSKRWLNAVMPNLRRRIRRWLQFQTRLRFGKKSPYGMPVEEALTQVDRPAAPSDSTAARTQLRNAAEAAAVAALARLAMAAIVNNNPIAVPPVGDSLADDFSIAACYVSPSSASRRS